MLSTKEKDFFYVFFLKFVAVLLTNKPRGEEAIGHSTPST